MTHEEVLQSNKAKNIAYLSAQNAKFGFGRQMPRTQNELEKVNAGIENNLLSTVHSKAKINDVTDADNVLKSEQYDTVNTSKEPLIGLKTTVHEKVDCRNFCDLGRPFVADGGVSIEIGGVSKKGNSTIEELMRDHFNLGGVFLNEGGVSQCH